VIRNIFALFSSLPEQTYVFEIVEVVPDPASDMKRSFNLRLRCRDEAKGPVTAVCGIDGYLVSSMGQKVNKNAYRKFEPPLTLMSFQIFVRAFDLDERLVGVAFLDVGVYVTTLRALKNLLIIGDAVKSVWFVAFQVRFTLPPSSFRRKLTNRTGPMQEDPYKLVVLAKDAHKVCITAADFFFADEQLSIVTCDEEGAVRMYAYDPESKRGGILTLSLSPRHPLLLVFASLSKVPSRTKDKSCCVKWNSMVNRITVPP